MRSEIPEFRLEEIKKEVLYMFEECEINTYPIDCFAIANKLHYVLRPYSSLGPAGYQTALSIDPDGFSRVELNQETQMYQYVIYYNDFANPGRMRWTILHEIGHIYLGHHDNHFNINQAMEEAEADFFAKYSIAPPPLINVAKCECPMDIYNTFKVSRQASSYLFDYFTKWKKYGPMDYEPFEIEMLVLFNAA